MGQDVAISNVGMRFGDFYAVRDINVHIQAGEFFSFLGPSGCGKTTLLRLISGFIDPTEGKIRIGGKDMHGIGPNRRPTAMIFQNLALFPLMTVADNIGFGLEVRRTPKAERIKKIGELLELVDLPDAGGKKVGDLSGGQKQRVAIARALAVEPAVLLLDEPLSALDLKLRKHMRAELRSIQRRTGVTFIYITHDQGEALTMSDRVAVMSHGKIEQVDEPDTIYNEPDTAFVASFVGENNALQGTIKESGNGYAQVETSLGTIRCRNPHQFGQGDSVVAFVRPETIVINGHSNGRENVIDGTIASNSFEGAYTNIRLNTLSGQSLHIRLNNDGGDAEYAPDTPANAAFKAENALVLAKGKASDA
jgi:spermidine/putrescine transport system ATP-binding protein